MPNTEGTSMSNEGGHRSDDDRPGYSERWIREARRALGSLGWTRRKLAQECAEPEANVHRVFKGTGGKSSVMKVASMLGIPDPFTYASDERYSEMGASMRQHDPERYAVVLASLRSFVHEDADREFEAIASFMRERFPDRFRVVMDVLNAWENSRKALEALTNGQTPDKPPTT